MMSQLLTTLKDLGIQKKRCFSLPLSGKDLADLTFNSLHSYSKERLDVHNFATINHVLQKALGKESKDIVV